MLVIKVKRRYPQADTPDEFYTGVMEKDSNGETILYGSQSPWDPWVMSFGDSDMSGANQVKEKLQYHFEITHTFEVVELSDEPTKFCIRATPRDEGEKNNVRD